MEFFIPIAIMALTIYIYYLWDTYSYWRRKGVVGPTPWPIFGNYGGVLFRLTTEIDLVQKLYDEYPEETFVGFYIGSRPVLMIKDPELFKYVLTKDIEIFSERHISFAAKDFTKNLFIMDGNDKWKFTRKALSPIFSKPTLVKFDAKFDEITKKNFSKVSEIVAKEPVQEMYSLMKTHARNIITDIVLGIDLGKKGEFEKTAHEVESLEGFELLRILEILFPRAMKTLKLFTRIIAKSYHKYFSDIMLRSLESRKNKRCDEADTYMDLFSELLEQEKVGPVKINDEHIVQNMLTFIVALIETSSNFATFVVHRLTLDQELQTKCFEEISQILQKYNGKLTMYAVSEMKYLGMVFDEILRLMPSSSILDRICKRKYQFLGANFCIDKGVFVFIPVCSIHHDKKYFPDPFAFNPERFSPQNKVNMPSNVYLPFSAGPRQCLGKNISKSMILYEVAALLLRYSIKPTEDTPKKIVSDRTLRFRFPVGSMPVSITKRC